MPACAKWIAIALILASVDRAGQEIAAPGEGRCLSGHAEPVPQGTRRQAGTDRHSEAKVIVLKRAFEKKNQAKLKAAARCAAPSGKLFKPRGKATMPPR